MIAFFDASTLIDLVEGKQPFASRVRNEPAAAARKHPGLGSIVSRLPWLECRVGPMKSNNQSVLVAFDAFFVRANLSQMAAGRRLLPKPTSPITPSAVSISPSPLGSGTEAVCVSITTEKKVPSARAL